MGATDQPPVLFTIGYQGASLESFIATLTEAGVRTLIDVRHSPWSRRPEFRHAPLKTMVEAVGIAVIHLQALGNPTEIREAAETGDRKAYEARFCAHLETEGARTALAEVLDRLAAGPCCLMCLERDPRDCHRLLVARSLLSLRELRVEHLHPALPARPSRQLRLL